MKKADLYKKIFNDVSKVNPCRKCLWKGCSSFAIESHSHTEKILRNISPSNHVYGINKNFLSLHNGDFFRSYGVREASVFHGFCNLHDSSLFKDIEDKNLDAIGGKEAFLLIARSVFFEYYQKKVDIHRTEKLIKILRSNDFLVNEEFADARMQGDQFYIDKDYPEYEKRIYENFEKSDFRDVLYKYRKIERFVPISLATNINPLFHKYVPKIGIAQPFFALHILPYKKYALVVMSWFKEHDPYMEWIKDKFDSDFNVLINYLCFIESEDFMLSPKFYDNKIKANKSFFCMAFFNRESFPDFGFNDTKIFFNFSKIR